MNRRIVAATLVVVLLPLMAGAARAADDDRAAVPLYPGMGSHHRPVTTSSAKTQQYFDQGLIWAYAFNHDEAIRSFTEAARLDPSCAMAWWGIALCHGPHINRPAMTEDSSRAAWAALQKARVLRNRATPVEMRADRRAGLRADGDPPPADRAALDKAYAEAMAQVWLAHRDDVDVGVLYAEAMMDLRPWDLWTVDRQPQPGTSEIVAVLEAVLQRDPDHPGGNHLYIHALEPSPHPEQVDAAADRLRGLVPASGHLVHMPSHIDVLRGRWRRRAARTNWRSRRIAATVRSLPGRISTGSTCFTTTTCWPLRR